MRLRTGIVIVILAALTSCGSCSGVGASGATNVDAVSAQTGSLFEDGPVDIPITIAKLEGPDPQLITVTVETLSPDISVPTLADDQIVVITGAAGAITVPEDTPFIMACDAGDTAIVCEFANVESDGSFQIRYAADDIAVYASTGEAQTALFSAPLIINNASTSPMYALTNSSLISPSPPLFAAQGVVYYQARNALTESVDVWASPVDGSQPYVVRSFDDAPLYTVPSDNGNILVVDAAGAFLAVSPVTPATLARYGTAPEYGEPVVLDDTELPPTSSGGVIDESEQYAFTRLGHFIFVKGSFVSGFALKVFDMESLTVVTLATSDEFNMPGLSMVATEQALYWLTFNEGDVLSRLQRLDLSAVQSLDAIQTAWENRTLVATFDNNELGALAFNGMMVSPDERYFIFRNTYDIGQTFLYEKSGETFTGGVIFDYETAPATLDSGRFSVDGASVYFCVTLSSDDGGATKAIWRYTVGSDIGSEPIENDFVATGTNVCNGRTIDIDDQFLYFLDDQNDLSLPQLTIMPIAQ